MLFILMLRYSCSLDGSPWMAVLWMAASWMAASSLNKTPLGETGCLSNPYFLLTGCLGIQFLSFTPLSQHSQLGYLWLPTPHFAALV